MISEDVLRSILAEVDDRVTSWWLREIRSNHARLSQECRAELARFLKHSLGHHNSALPQLLEAARVFEQAAYRRKNPLRMPHVFWLLPAVRDLDPALADRASKLFDEKAKRQADSSAFSATVEALEQAGLPKERAYLAAGYAVLHRHTAGRASEAAQSQSPEEMGDDTASAGDDGCIQEPPAATALSWPSIVSWAEALPCEDARWSEAESTIERLSSIVEEKRAERAAAQVSTARKKREVEHAERVFAALAEYSGESAYLRAMITLPDPASVDTDTLRALVSSVETLTTALAALRRARALPAETAEQEDERFAAVASAKKGAISAHAELTQLHPLSEAERPSHHARPRSSNAPSDMAASGSDESITGLAVAIRPVSDDKEVAVETQRGNEVLQAERPQEDSPPPPPDAVNDSVEPASPAAVAEPVEGPNADSAPMNDSTRVEQGTSTARAARTSEPPVRSSRKRRPDSQPAGRLLADDDNPRVALLWNGDLAGAYWFEVGAASLGELTPKRLPAWLLGAVQASDWLAQAPALVNALADLVDTQSVGDDDEAQTLALAAALVPSVVHPETHMRGWLVVQGPVAAPLRKVVDAIAVFANLGQPLSKTVADALQNTSESEAAAAMARHKLAVWLKNAPHHTTKLQRGTLIWRDGLQKELAGVIREALDGKNVRESLGRWRDPTFVRKRIRQLGASMGPANAKPVDFGAREQLEAWSREASDMALDFLALSQEETGGDWLLGRARELRAVLADDGVSALEELRELSTGGSAVVQGLSAVLARALARLLALFGISATLWMPAEASPSALLRELVKDTSSIDEALRQRLLLLPDLYTAGDLKSEQSARALMVAMTSPPPSAADVVRDWGRRGRFDLAQRLLAGAPASADLATALEQSLASARLELARTVEDTAASIESGVVDGYAAQERAELSAQLSAIGPTASLLDLARARDAVEGVERRLAALRREHLNETRARWEDLKQRLGSRLDPTLAIERAQFIEEAIEKEDVRAADEAIYQLDDRVRAHSDLTTPARAVRQSERITPLREFAREYTAMVETRTGGLARIIKHFDDVRFEKIVLPTGQKRDAIRRGLQAWLRLKNKENAFDEALVDLFGYFGFTVMDKAVTTSQAGSSGSSWRAFRVRMNDGGMSPVPQFGSGCQSEYRVLCAWERPGADTLSGIFHQLSREPTILLYLGRLMEAQRLSLRNSARQQELAVICIDESLVVFLAGERDLRLRALFDCTLPYAVLNPYTPFQAGDVPREMYFGRKDTAGRLKDPSGTCIVYGGRQLGKSALLRKVQREFHAPDRHQFSTVVDIKLLGDPAAREDPASFWPRLREELQRIGFSSKKMTSDDPDRICEGIRAQCQEWDSRLLLLLDEADNLLDYDSRHGFRIIDKLRELMASTGRRFKVVLAGLHNVQRFHGLPNQPLAHFGHAIQVGPLEPADAMELVTAPLAALGFEFESVHDVLRILSYTNYHPGLIQLFCYELVRLLHSRLGQAHPPIRIRRENVEAVYLKEQVREGIRQRFDWTLALDPRYQVVAWSVIYDLEERRSLDPLTAAKILELARVWWPAGFESGLDELNGLLDEMCGLGVLVRGDRGYRLRSPNVVRLIGDVEPRLLELANVKPPPVFDAAQHHRPMGSGLHSPITFDDERRILGPESGVVLLFGSNALGLDRLPQALDAMASGSANARGHVLTIPEGASLLAAFFSIPGDSCERTSHGKFTPRRDDGLGDDPSAPAGGLSRARG